MEKVEKILSGLTTAKIIDNISNNKYTFAKKKILKYKPQNRKIRFLLK